MKSLRIAVSTLVMLAFCSTLTLAAPDSQKGFDQLKTLAGNWAGKAGDRPIQVEFRVTSGGSAIMSEIKTDEDMISMFHLDRDRLMMTHYCGAGNQPRMVGTVSADGKTFTFDFLDATNLSSPDTGHMHRLVLTMVDANHHTEDWSFATGKGEDMREHFDLVRQK